MGRFFLPAGYVTPRALCIKGAISWSIYTEWGLTVTNLRCRILHARCEKAKVLYGDKAVNKKGEKVGLVFHSLRKTRITKWVEMGFSDEIVRRASGHKSLEAYQEYVKLGPQSVMCLVENATKTLQNHSKAA